MYLLIIILGKLFKLMKRNSTFFIFFILILISFSIPGIVKSQIENVPLNNPVYIYLKEMRVKRIINNFNDDNPNLSRFQVSDHLNEINLKKNELSKTEKELLEKYLIEFDPDYIDKKTTMSLIESNMDVSNGFKYLFSDKQKYLFAYKKKENNIFIEALGNLYYINGIEPTVKKNSWIFDVGLRVRGSLFDHLGYNFSILKGGASGDSVLIERAFPQIKANFKYQENIENITNYDFTTGYLKYNIEPTEGMNISAQLGREKIVYGLGYSKRLALSGDAPDMDFLKFNFQYGIINFSSIFGSTVGEYTPVRDDRYTKYFTANRLKLAFDNLFDIGLGETVISSRGIELGYLNPIIFYKFVEHSLQDRDNGTIFVDLQTHFLKDLELQGTFFLDENILSNLSDMTKASNKTAYQLGFFWYEPVGLENLSLIFEYTKIRPYVYSHFDIKNTYTAFGVNMGHPAGPNSDQLFAKLTYNLNDNLRFKFEYQKIRKGENIYNQNGELVRNVGGDIFQPYIPEIDADEAYFLDGERVNNFNLLFNVIYEPIKDFNFELNYTYNNDKYLSTGKSNDLSYGYLRFYFDY